MKGAFILYANKINITKHALQTYKDRVDNECSDEEITPILTDIFKYGKSKKLRTCAFENNATEFICLKDDVEILVIVKYHKSEEGKKKYREAIIITCLGDSVNRKWYKSQNKRRKKRARSL